MTGTMWGALPGSRGGAYAYYQFEYPGDNSKVNLKMTLDLDAPGMAEGVSFVVYGPTGQVARGRPTNKPGEREDSFSSGAAGTYLIQVYNYLDGITVNYTIAR